MIHLSGIDSCFPDNSGECAKLKTIPLEFQSDDGIKGVKEVTNFNMGILILQMHVSWRLLDASR